MEYFIKLVHNKEKNTYCAYKYRMPKGVFMGALYDYRAKDGSNAIQIAFRELDCTAEFTSILNCEEINVS